MRPPFDRRHGLRFLRRAFFALVLLGFGAFLPSAAPAQQIKSIPAERFITSPGNVDMRTGRYVYSHADLSAGEGGAAFAFERIMPDYAAAHANPFGNFSHNWDVWIVESRIDLSKSGNLPGIDYRMNVHMNGRSITFDSRSTSSGYGYSGYGPTPFLTFTGDRASASAVYTLRTDDGTLVTFRSIGSNDCAGPQSPSPAKRCAYASSITRPDGTRFDLTYAASGLSTGNNSRLTRVTSSRGDVLILEGSGNVVTKACLINARNTTPPSANVCPQTALATTTYSYTTTSPKRLVTVVDPTNGQWGFTYAGSGSTFTMGFVNPGQSTPWLVNSVSWKTDEEATPQEITNSQSFSDGHSFSYIYNLTPSVSYPPYGGMIMGGTYTDNLGATVYVTYGFPILPGSRPGDGCVFNCPLPSPDDFEKIVYQPTPEPVTITDALGHSTHFNYCDPAVESGLPSNYRDRCAVVPLVDTTDPGGIKTAFTYDGWTNVLQLTRTAKAGSGLADLVQSFTYQSCYDYPASCRKPLTETDARGNTTVRNYAAGHGGLLSEMKPPPAVGGARPLTLVTWSQRYAWAKNTAGVLVQSTAPIWVKASETQCQTLAGSNPAATCDPAAPQTVTNYEYGPTGTGDSLLVKGIAVAANGQTLRSCYGYDPFGRKSSQTKPNANLSVCP
jgi:YD repeat-containing protein